MTRPTRFLGYGRQHVDDADIAAVVAVLKGDYLTQGPAVERFEAALAKRVGARFAVAVSSGTAALHVACLTAGLTAGDRAAVPTLTFGATANAANYCTTDVMLTDVDAGTLGMPAQALAAAMTDSQFPAAVLPVHFAGLAAGMPAIRAASGNAVVIEDACHSLGGTYEDGRPVGCCGHSDMAVFSFHPVKPITTAEGGALVTNDPEFARRATQFRSHGIERDPARFINRGADAQGPWYYEQQVLGYNYRMTDMQAALGLSQLDRLDALLARRRQIAAYYDDSFSNLDGVTVHQAGAERRSRSGMHLYVLGIEFETLGLTRTEVMVALRERGVGTQVHYIPLHRQPFHRQATGAAPEAFPNAEAYYRGALSIPLHATLTDAEVEYVAAAIKIVLARQGAP